MKNCSTFSTLLALGLAWCSTTSAPAEDRTISQADRAEITARVLSVHDQATAAAEALDLDRLFSFVAENEHGALVTNGTIIATRAEALARTRGGFRGIAGIKYSFSQRDVTVLSATSALLVVAGSMAATTDDGRSLTNAFVQTNVFVLRDGNWRIVHTHQSTAVPPPA